MGTKGESIERLWTIIDRLRGDNGCPWDKKQTPESVKTYIVEEAHEVDAAIRSGNTQEVMEELGDLLFMALFMIHLYEEEGVFNFENVCTQTENKMIRRHPHVFGSLQVGSADEVKDNWEKIKQGEKQGTQSRIPKTLPALTRAYRMLSRNLLKPTLGDSEKDLSSLIEDDLKKLFFCSQDEFGRYFGDLLIKLCQLARIRGFRPEDLLQKRLDECEVIK